MVLILKTLRLEKSLQEIYRFNVSTEFDGLLKMYSVELKMRFLPTAPIHIEWYIRTFFDCLGVIKCVIHLEYALHSFSSYLYQKQSTHKFFINLLDCSRLHVGFLSDILAWSLF
jgi:hypothetical protein